MSRQAVISLPLSFAIVLVAAIGLSGTIPEGGQGSEGLSPPHQGTIADAIEPVKSESPRSDAEPGPSPAIDDRADALADADRPKVVRSVPGESLSAVADRVFGSTDMVGPLIDANPQLDVEPWRPLPEGTALRLP